MDSPLRELHLTQWTFTSQQMLEVTHMIPKNNWFSPNLLTLRVNKDTFQAFAQSIVQLNDGSSNYEVVVQSDEMQE